MDFKKLRTRFRQFGGMKLVKEYSRLGLILPIMGSFFKCLFTGKSFKLIYPVIEKKTVPVLSKKYGPLVDMLWDKYESQNLSKSHCNKVWVCWFQGFDKAPEMVLACLNSLRKNLPDREIVLIDEANMCEYVTFPDYILEKWHAGVIPAPSFSNLVRLELLAKYGGSWIDSTVLCTGTNFPSEYLDADLFLFRYNRPDDFGPMSISTWFISSETNNTALLVLRDMLYAYWRDYDCLIYYYIMHRFFAMISLRHPELSGQIPYGPSYLAITLLSHWGDAFDSDKWEAFTSRVAFHKLSFRPPQQVQDDKSNYYNEILRQYLPQ